MRKMKRMVSVIMTAAMTTSLLVGCDGSGDPSTTAARTEVAGTAAAAAAETTIAETAADTMAALTAAENPVAGKKVAYIMLLPSTAIFQVWRGSCVSLCDAPDIEFDFFFCDGDFNKWQDTIRTRASAGYDGLLVSHDNQDGSYILLEEITGQYLDMKIVTFDTQFYSDEAYQRLPGVTQMFRQDKPLVTTLLDQMIEKCGEGARLAKVWRGPNYNSPFDRREIGQRGYEAASKTVTVDKVQPLQDSVDPVNTVTAAYLQGVNKADVDGVVAYYDLYSQDVYSAIAENGNFNGKNSDALPTTSVDINPVDVTNMQTCPDIWTAAGTTGWITNGEIGVRIPVLELAGRYDKTFDPATGGSSVGVVEAPGTAIKADTLKPDSTVENLGSITGKIYGNLDYPSTVDWMPRDLIHKQTASKKRGFLLNTEPQAIVFWGSAGFGLRFSLLRRLYR